MKLLPILAAAICVVLIGLGIYEATRPVKIPPRVVPLSADYQTRVDKGGWITGAADPKVTVIEYADFQCPACDAMAPIIRATMQQTSSIAQFQVRIYPLENIHDKALIAATAGESAGRQGKFWEMYDQLFNTQKDWDQESIPAFKDTLNDYAAAIGLNVQQFKQDMIDPEIGKLIDKNIDEGNKDGLTATPTILVNGKSLDTTTLQQILSGGVPQFVQIINNAAGA